MSQGVLPLRFEEEKGDPKITGHAGLVLYLDILKKMNFKEMIRQHLNTEKKAQGWPAEWILISLILMNLAGGESVSDMRILEKDNGLHRILEYIGGRKGKFGRGRYNQLFRNGKKNNVPSESCIFRYLECFQNEEEESKRESGKAFIPSSNENLVGLKEVYQKILEYLQLVNPQEEATLDMDATIIYSNKEEALWCYKGGRGYQPMNVFWKEQAIILYSEFRDGNVPAGFEQRRVLQEALLILPEGIKRVYVRSDSAGYQHDLMRYCEKGENEKYGRIGFGISCDVTDAFKNEVFKVAEAEWKVLYKEINGKMVKSNQEWAEVNFVPNALGHSKKSPDYHYYAVREPLEQGEFSIMDDEIQQSLPFPNMKIGNRRYKITGYVTNLKSEGDQVIRWIRGRCGASEQIHSEMKEGYAGGRMPSGKFGANAAWWWIMLMAMSLTVILRVIGLNKMLEKARIKNIRYLLINIPGRVIKKGKELIIRITREHPSFGLLVAARQGILNGGFFTG